MDQFTTLQEVEKIPVYVWKVKIMKRKYNLKREPTRKEKRFTAKSLRSYFFESRAKNPDTYSISYGVFGNQRTNQRMSKGHAQSIYFTQLRKVMNITDKKRGRK